jgi:hypothetical protein
MNNNSTIFQQILQFIPNIFLESLVKKYQTDKYCKSFTTSNLLTCLLYAQAKGKDSLRDIETGLLTHESSFYHLGFTQNGVKRSTLADANKRVDYRVFQDLFYKLLDKYSSGIFTQKFDFNKSVYAIDATFVDVVVDMFPWAKYRTTKGAIKIHTVYNINKQVPTLVNITEGEIHDLAGMPYLDKDKYAGSVVVFDKGYWSAYRLSLLNKRGVYFVTRIKDNVTYEIVGQQKVDLGSGVLKDEVIRFKSDQLKSDYPKKLRLVTYYDEKHKITYRFVTNLFNVKAKSIADIYKYRWQIELFFKWIKQNLIVKSFLGCSKNAVFNQIWIALIYYLLVSHIYSQAKYDYGKLELTRVISEVLFERFSLIDILRADFKSIKKIKPESKDQLFLSTG